MAAPKRRKVGERKKPIHKRVGHAFVRYFVPHKKHNNFQPYFLRIEVATGTALVILVLFFGSIGMDKVLQSGSPQVAAVVSATLVDLANTDRAQNGLPPLTENAQLREAAQLKADDMAAKGYFAHNSPDGHDPWYWFSQAGYNFSYAGENLAVYFSDSNDVNNAWMNSTEHRANILSASFTQIGIATAQGEYEGVATTFVVEEFGTPAGFAAAASPPPPVQVAAAAPAPNVAHAPEVAGAEVQKPKVIVQTPTFIAVKSANAPAPSFAVAGATAPSFSTRISTAFLSAATSPQSDMILLYEFLGMIIGLALIFEVVVEFRRFYPHRLAYGFSLVCLMFFLVYLGHAAFVGNVLIV